jgi:endonuclease/exonuclease/phosphatase family metal-dependent hydrolase
MTFNIRNGRAFDGANSWWLRRRAAAAAMRTASPDVAGLQEVFRFQERWLLAQLPAYRSVGAGRDDGTRGERCPVLVRAGDGLEIVASETRWFSGEPERAGSRLAGASFPRIATMARLQHRLGGPRFGVANVHLDERVEANRLESVELLLSWLDRSVPWIVLGDFNATPAGPELRTMKAAGFESVLGAMEPGTAHGFTGRLDGHRIDHVLVRLDEWRVNGARVVTDAPRGRLPSDHWPVVADVVPVAGG